MPARFTTKLHTGRPTQAPQTRKMTTNYPTTAACPIAPALPALPAPLPSSSVSESLSNRSMASTTAQIRSLSHSEVTKSAGGGEPSRSVLDLSPRDVATSTCHPIGGWSSPSNENIQQYDRAPTASMSQPTTNTIQQPLEDMDGPLTDTAFRIRGRNNSSSGTEEMMIISPGSVCATRFQRIDSSKNNKNNNKNTEIDEPQTNPGDSLKHDLHIRPTGIRIPDACELVDTSSGSSAISPSISTGASTVAAPVDEQISDHNSILLRSPSSCMEAEMITHVPPFPLRSPVCDGTVKPLLAVCKPEDCTTDVSSSPAGGLLSIGTYPAPPRVATLDHHQTSDSAQSRFTSGRGDYHYSESSDDDYNDDSGSDDTRDPINDTQPQPKRLQFLPSNESLESLAQNVEPSSLGKEPAVRRSSILLHHSSAPSSSTSSIASNHRRPSTQRRVRGIWNPVVSTCENGACTEDSATAVARDSFTQSSTKETTTTSSPFDSLRNDTMTSIASHLDLLDVSRLGMVNRRWRYITSQDALWRSVDATSFVQHVHQKNVMQLSSSQSLIKSNKAPKVSVPTKRTSLALCDMLKRHSGAIRNLTIQSIGSALSADIFLPAYASLKELTLTDFDDLSDTYLHVMLLTSSLADPSARTRHQGTALRKLVLDGCARLTNSSLRFIASRCAELEELSLRRISGINDIKALQDFIGVPSVPSLSARPSTIQKTDSSTGLQSMFAAKPPVPARLSFTTQSRTPSSVQSLFTPPLANSRSPTTRSSAPSLGSLFSSQPPAAKVANTRASASPLSSMFGPPPPKTESVASPLRSMFSPPTSSEGKVFPKQAPSSGSQLSSIFSPPPAKRSSLSAPSTQQQKSEQSPLSSMFQPPASKTNTAPNRSPLLSAFNTPTAPKQPPVSPRDSLSVTSNGGLTPSKPKTTSDALTSPKSALQSLFAPPGTSPPRPSRPLLASRSMSSSSMISSVSSKLQHLHLDSTGVTVESILALGIVKLDTLSITGSDNDDWETFASLVSLVDLYIHSDGSVQEATIEMLQAEDINVHLV